MAILNDLTKDICTVEWRNLLDNKAALTLHSGIYFVRVLQQKGDVSKHVAFLLGSAPSGRSTPMR